MAQSAKRFAHLLQEGINAIVDRTGKPKGVIRDELGYAIGRKGGSAIEYWAYGDGRIPKDQQEVTLLARTLVAAGKLDQGWLTAFLESAGYPHREDLLADLFPASANVPSRTLPMAPTPFVGRTRELAELAAHIGDANCRLITLVGPGGSGKTRLAVEVAKQVATTFADGATFVPLAPLASADLMMQGIAVALNLTLAGDAQPQEQLVNYLRRQQRLLVLDNFEHLLPTRA
ncbi:MAG: AAA family ATPase, partial [Caldilineaceae bacterium]|nr:AAA family ATPase [Caldilineaceae bacterium]